MLSTPEPYFGRGGNPVAALYIWNGGLGIWGAIAGNLALITGAGVLAIVIGVAVLLARRRERGPRLKQPGDVLGRWLEDDMCAQRGETVRFEGS